MNRREFITTSIVAGVGIPSCKNENYDENRDENLVLEGTIPTVYLGDYCQIIFSDDRIEKYIFV